MLIKVYGQAMAEEIARLMRPTSTMLNKEWGLLQIPECGTTRAKLVHYCPTGDIRAIKGKGCELCGVLVPEAVQFLATALIQSR